MSENGNVKAALSQKEVESLAEKFERESPQELLAFVLEKFGDKVALSSSFGAEDVALIDMLWRINPKARVFTLDTLRLPKETYEVMDKIRQKYEMNIEVFYPKADAVQKMVKSYGLNLFYESLENRKLCCGIRKVEPLERALSTVDAWIAGLRRDQVSTRANVKKIEFDEARPNKIKLNPLADWTSEMVWDYIRKNDVPYNALHDKNYPSIGCDPCTRPIRAGEDPRAGRWWWELDPNSKECGLHVAEPVRGLEESKK